MDIYAKDEQSKKINRSKQQEILNQFFISNPEYQYYQGFNMIVEVMVSIF